MLQLKVCLFLFLCARPDSFKNLKQISFQDRRPKRYTFGIPLSCVILERDLAQIVPLLEDAFSDLLGGSCCSTDPPVFRAFVCRNEHKKYLSLKFSDRNSPFGNRKKRASRASWTSRLCVGKQQASEKNVLSEQESAEGNFT